MVPDIVLGNITSQDTEVIVNAWNRNLIPWWLLLPQGVSGAIKKAAGLRPFRELAKAGAIPLGNAVMTSAGRLPQQAIIHVAGINMFWRASEKSIRNATRNAVSLAAEKGFKSIAFPLIGSGSGGFEEEAAIKIMVDALSDMEYAGAIRIVRLLRSDCYCSLWHKEPDFLSKQGVPFGYCGMCACGRPGHLRHFPGAVPASMAWCDKHYNRLRLLHPLGSGGFLLWSGLVALAVWALTHIR